MDIHRSRFVPYPTSAISALAFSRSSDSGFTGPLPSLKLALGRSNGDIEIWNPQNGSWVQEAVFPGNNRSIDGVAWTQDPDELDAEGKRILGQQRLFSIASSPSVTEWDLGTGTPKRQSTGNFSEVWCFAAQPRAKQKNLEEQTSAQEIVAGCEDGTLVLLSTADNDLQFKKFLARVGGKRARCMSMAYQNREWVAAGFADGMIRIYDTRNGSLLRGMSLGASLPGMPKNALVWQVRCLPNGDIVTGDSNGEVKFWDGRTYSLSQRLVGHDSDCLDLATSSDGKTVFSGSIDGKIAVFRQSAGNDGRKTWARASQRRVHVGEVKSMTSFESKMMSIVVSGGSDVAPIITPLREYGKENIRSLPTLPQEPPVVSAPRARLMASWWSKNISVWRIARQNVLEEADVPVKARRLVAKLTLDTRDCIRSVAMSTDGRVIAASTSTTIKVFQLKNRVGGEGLSVRKMHLPKDLASVGARLLSLSPDGKWLVATTPDSEVHIARFASEGDDPKRIKVLSRTVELERRYLKPSTPSALKAYDQTISRLAFASDSSVLVASDMSGHIDSWVLEGHEDPTAPAVDTAKHDSDNSSAAPSDSDSDSDSSDDDDDTTTIFYGQHWTGNPSGHLLPKLDSPPLILTFRPSRQQPLTNGNPGLHATRHNPHAHSHELPQGQHRLLAITAKHQIYELDVLAGRLSDWSRRNPTAVLPEDFKKIRDRVMGAMWDVQGERERLWVYGPSFLCMLNVGVDLALDPEAQALKKRRRRPKDGSARGEEDAEAVNKRRKLESGAGGKVDAAHQPGFGEAARRVENGKMTEIDLGGRQGTRGEVSDQEDGADEEDDDGDDDEVGLSLTRMRSQDAAADDEQERALVKSSEGQGQGQGQKEKRWWVTFKYRPILGMVPISEQSVEGDKPLEVVLVERPAWDAQGK